MTTVIQSRTIHLMGRELKACQDLFLDKAWNLAEWAPLRSWQGMEADVVALHVLGRELGLLQGRWQGALKAGVADVGGLELPIDSEEAVEEYLEMGRKLEEGVKFSCPWPQLREVMGRPRTQLANLSLEGRLSPSLGRRPEAL